jgi:hypothetical protein
MHVHPDLAFRTELICPIGQVATALDQLILAD